MTSNDNFSKMSHFVDIFQVGQWTLCMRYKAKILGFRLIIRTFCAYKIFGNFGWILFVLCFIVIFATYRNKNNILVDNIRVADIFHISNSHESCYF